jgi:hypothetical protein
VFVFCLPLWCLLRGAALQDVQDFMQQLLGAIADHFPQQALWAMATVCKSTVRARQVRQAFLRYLLCRDVCTRTDGCIPSLLWVPSHHCYYTLYRVDAHDTVLPHLWQTLPTLHMCHQACLLSATQPCTPWTCGPFTLCMMVGGVEAHEVS